MYNNGTIKCTHVYKINLYIQFNLTGFGQPYGVTVITLCIDPDNFITSIYAFNVYSLCILYP